MTRHPRRLRDALSLAAVAAMAMAELGCGLEVDAGVVPPRCSMSFTVAPEPAEPGQELVVSAVVYDTTVSGFHVYEWSVALEGEPVPFEVVGAAGDIIEFAASRPGGYTIGLDGSIGGLECTGDVRDDVKVIAEGARSEAYLLRVIPAAGDPAPPQDARIELWGGADYPLGTIGVAAGAQVSGVSLDGDGQPVPAYLRAWPSNPLGGAPLLLTETFAGADGMYELRLLPGEHDLLVVPGEPDRAPYLVTGIQGGDIAAGTVLEHGLPVTGAVLDGSGAPVAGARVSLVVGGVPSAIGVTGAAGGFTLEARAGGPVSVRVIPPDPSGLPQLELAAPAGSAIAGSAAIAVQYAASLSARSVSPAVRAAGGAPAPGSLVTWVARPVAGAGTVSVDGGEALPAVGLVRRTVRADAGGSLPSTLLTEATYDVLIEPPVGMADQAVSVAEVDLAAGAPAELGLATPAALRGVVLAADGEAPLAGVRVQAVPRDLLAGSARAGASARTGADGGFELGVAGGASYEIAADATALGQGRLRWVVTAPAPGAALELEPATLPRVQRARGQMNVEGGGGALGGAHLQLFCAACGPAGRAAPVAETITDPTGRFVLIAPDPGVAPPE